jgi:hypothetical protein
MADNNKHDASGQLAGYFFQVLSALLLLMKNKNSEALVCIEKFDDVAFIRNENETDHPYEVVQIKHQLSRQGNLNDTSNDLWRTINCWCDLAKRIPIEDIDFIIITTAIAKDSTVASYLKESNRNCSKALDILRNIANSDTVQTNKSFYESFRSLDERKQKNLVDHVYVYDNIPPIGEIKDSIKYLIRLTVLQKFEDQVCERIIGWWIDKVIKCLVSQEPAFISFRHLQNTIVDLGSEYKSDSLPLSIDQYYEPTGEDLEKALPKRRIFLEQLRLIKLDDRRLNRCLRDYYNAYQQRGKWVRENLLFMDDDIKKYEAALVDEWEDLYLIMKENLKEYGIDLSEDKKCTEGRQFFNKIMALDLRIRTGFSEPFVMRGTFHGLSNEKLVGWHVDFRDRIHQLLEEVPT